MFHTSQPGSWDCKLILYTVRGTSNRVESSEWTCFFLNPMPFLAEFKECKSQKDARLNNSAPKPLMRTEVISSSRAAVT